MRGVRGAEGGGTISSPPSTLVAWVAFSSSLRVVAFMVNKDQEEERGSGPSLSVQVGRKGLFAAVCRSSRALII